MNTTIEKTGRVDLATTALRISLGSMFLAHSLILKYGVYTLEGTAAYFESVALPGWLAYAVFWMEAVGGLLLVAGIGSRWVSLVLMPILFGALWVHSGNGWVFTSTGGGWEYPLYLIVLSGVQVLLGDGAFGLASARHSGGECTVADRCAVLARGFVRAESDSAEAPSRCPTDPDLSAEIQR